MTAEKKPETKRARRKLGANPSQLWPQMPKITDATARAKAYLKVAGLYHTANPSNSKAMSKKALVQPLDPQLDIMNAPEIKFGRLLASTEQRVRHAAVQRLSQYLTARCAVDQTSETIGLSELDLLKLWKGLWFTLYMADRVPVQDELSKQLAKMIWCVAGTEEEDEYAAKTYLDMNGDDYHPDEDDDDDDGDEDDENGDEDDDDDPEVIMQEIFNTTKYKYADDEEEEEDQDDEEDDDDDEEGLGDNEDEDDNEEHEDHDHDEDGNCMDDTDEEDEMDAALIPHCRGAHLAALFIKTFFQTVRRDWGRMDKYRVDKFYTLIRFMMEQVYEYMATRHWNIGIVRLFNDTIYEEVLTQTPNGLRLHLIDLSLHELAKVNARAPMPLTEATFVDVLEPYFAMAQICRDKSVQARVVDKVMHGFLDLYSVVSEGAGSEGAENESKDSLIMTEVHVGTVADFIFSLGSDSDTRDEYRESLYSTYKDFKRRLKQVGKDVDLNMADDNVDDEEDADRMEEDEQVRVIEVDDAINFVGDDHVHDKKELSRKKTKEVKKASSKDVQEKSASKEEKEQNPKDKTSKKRSHSEVEGSGENDGKEVNKTSKKSSTKKKKVNKEKSSAPAPPTAAKASSIGQVKSTKNSENASNMKKSIKVSIKHQEQSMDAAIGTGDDDNVSHDITNGGNKVETEVEETSPKTKASKKKKKKGKQEVLLESQVAGGTSSSTNDQGEKKKPKSSPVKEEVITISVAAQKQAKEAAIMASGKGGADLGEKRNSAIQEEPMKGPKKKKQRKETEAEKEARRVSFGKVNHSKSHKASMKALRTMPSPKLVSVTPEKSILLKKTKSNAAHTPTSGGKGKANRKKAADYF